MRKILFTKNCIKIFTTQSTKSEKIYITSLLNHPVEAYHSIEIFFFVRVRIPQNSKQTSEKKRKRRPIDCTNMYTQKRVKKVKNSKKKKKGKNAVHEIQE